MWATRRDCSYPLGLFLEQRLTPSLIACAVIGSRSVHRFRPVVLMGTTGSPHSCSPASQGCPLRRPRVTVIIVFFYSRPTPEPYFP